MVLITICLVSTRNQIKKFMKLINTICSVSTRNKKKQFMVLITICLVSTKNLIKQRPYFVLKVLLEVVLFPNCGVCIVNPMIEPMVVDFDTCTTSGCTKIWIIDIL